MNRLSKIALTAKELSATIPLYKKLQISSLNNYNKITNAIKKAKPVKLEVNKLHLGK